MGCGFNVGASEEGGKDLKNLNQNKVSCCH